MEYLGHKVDTDGLHLTTAKIKAVVDAPTPKNLNELKSYLGLLNYYGRFLPNLSTMIHSQVNYKVKAKSGYGLLRIIRLLKAVRKL